MPNSIRDREASPPDVLPRLRAWRECSVRDGKTNGDVNGDGRVDPDFGIHLLNYFRALPSPRPVDFADLPIGGTISSGVLGFAAELSLNTILLSMAVADKYWVWRTAWNNPDLSVDDILNLDPLSLSNPELTRGPFLAGWFEGQAPWELDGSGDPVSFFENRPEEFDNIYGGTDANDIIGDISFDEELHGGAGDDQLIATAGHCHG